MANSITESRRSNTNNTSNLVEARIISNFGDPGLTETYFFDILSTFLIVMIESIDRVPCYNNMGGNLFAICARPSNLWINAGPITNNPTNQTRTDSFGNVCQGQPGQFSINGIAGINQPYQLGEKIKMRKLSQPYTFNPSSDYFASDIDGFSQGITQYSTIYSNNNPATTLPYIQNAQNGLLGVNTIPLVQIQNQPIGTYAYFIQKYMYEAFILNYNQTYNSQNVVGLTSLFAGNGINGNNSIYSFNGGYLFNNNNYTNNLWSVNYEDVNFGNKMRISENDCAPLIVAVPSTWPTPAIRAIGNVSYNPSYSQIQIG